MPDLSLPFFNDINRRIYDNKLKIGDVVHDAFDENWFSEYQHLYLNDPTARPGSVRVHVKYRGKDAGFFNRRTVDKKVPPYHSKQFYELSETYLKPPPSLSNKVEKSYIKCMAEYRVGEFTVSCSPYIMPNPNFGVCAQASAWIALKILEAKSDGIVRCRPIPKIQKAARGNPYADSDGLPIHKIRRLIKMNNCEVFEYDNLKMGLSFEEMFNIVYAYVESGFPVILGVDVSKLDWWKGYKPDYHSVVLIGHTLTKKTGTINGFILHDESKYPYLKIKKAQLKKAWDVTDQKKPETLKDKKFRRALVGVPPVVRVGYETTFDHKLYIDFMYKEGIIKKKKFPVRPLLTGGLGVILHLANRERSDKDFDKLFKEELAKIGVPNWIWFLRFYEKDDKRLTDDEIGGIIFDASVTGKPLFSYFEDVKFVHSFIE